MLRDWTFHHIGIAVLDIDTTAAVYLQAGYVKSPTKYDPLQNVYICFLSKGNMPLIELLAPADDTSPVYNTLDKMGVTPYHICYQVENIEQSIIELRKQQYVVVKRPEIAVAIDNHKVCFLYNKSVGLIELVEK